MESKSHDEVKKAVIESTSLREVSIKLGGSKSESSILSVRKLISNYKLDSSHFRRKSSKTIEERSNKFNKSEERRNRKRNKVAKEFRKNTENLPSILLHDYMKSDISCGFGRNDLTEDFIRESINNGCNYCGATSTSVRMTLDRIDNSRGHLKSNTIPSCYRCNMIRRDMPYDAWQLLVPSVRKAQESGLFRDWLSSPIRH